MAQIQKPDSINKIWSSAGDISLPPDQKIREGWEVEIPPREWFNWLDNKQDLSIAHINQHGIAVWDDVTEYQGQKSYAQDPSTGVVYRCLVTNTGNIPSNSPTFWKKAFLDNDDPLIVNAVPHTRRIITGTGLSGGGDLSADRTLSVNFGTTAGTVTQGNDSRLSNAREWTADTVPQAEAEAGTATTRRAWTAQRVRQAIVAWFNGATTAFTRTILGRSNAAQIRTDLQLGTAATSNIQTARDDVNNQVMIVGGFGVGLNGQGLNVPNGNADTNNISGLWRASSSVVGNPFNDLAHFIHFSNQENVAYQIWLSSNRMGFKMRQTSGAFRPFHELYHTGNVTKLKTDLQLGTAASADLTIGAVDKTSGRVLKTGDYGLGGHAPSTALSNSAANIPSGFYYATGGEGSGLYGGGPFYIQHTWRLDATPGFRISNQPYTENFYLHGAIEANNRGLRSGRLIYHAGNFNPSSKVDTTRTVATGTGLTGGGNLTANRTISLASTHIPLGVGQTWQNVTGSRSLDTNYTNTTGRPIYVSATIHGSFDTGITLTVNSLVVARCGQSGGDGNDDNFVTAVIPPGSTYSVRRMNTWGTVTWMELR